MGFLDKVKDMFGKGGAAQEMAEEHGDKIADGVDKATDMADEKTGGAHTEHLDKVDDMADKLRDGEEQTEDEQ